MVSSLGCDVITSCAAARGGITRITEMKFSALDEGSGEMVPVKGHVIKGIVEGFEGLGRLIRLGAIALRDLLEYSNLHEEHLLNTAIFLHLSDNYYDDQYFKREHEEMLANSSFGVEDTQLLNQEFNEEKERSQAEIQSHLISRILEQNHISISSRSHYYSFGGDARFVEALIQAMGLLQKGMVERCIVGGIDSLVEDQSIERLYKLGLIHSVDNAEGFFPGEGAAFILLEKFDAARSRKAAMESIIRSPAFANEPFHRLSDESPTGKALYSAIAASYAGVEERSHDLRLVIGNLNGDSYRAQDYGNALLRMRAIGFPTDLQQWFPPFSFGETGAATGAMAICFGVRGLVRGYATSRDILVWLSSDDGNKSALILSAVT